MTAAQGSRVSAIEQALVESLDATHVEIMDDSELHANHPGAQAGGGHFRVLVVSERFRGLSRVAAQRLVFDALGDLMRAEIHALQMKTLTPEAWHAAQGGTREPR
jgi:BolA protein